MHILIVISNYKEVAFACLIAATRKVARLRAKKQRLVSFPLWLHNPLPLEVQPNWDYHVQLQIDIDEFMAKSFLDDARNLTISIFSWQS